MAGLDETGTTVRFVPRTGVCVTDNHNGSLVVAVGRVSRPGGPVNEPRLIAFSRDTGAAAWSAVVPAPTLDSFSSPVFDPGNQSVIYCSSNKVSAFSVWNGAPLWQAPLTRGIVNATPVVTSDRPGVNRLFITDFHGGGTNARLYCINVDPYIPTLNPFQPGQIVWSTVIGGSSGNSPAYDAGVVYVASTGRFNSPPNPNLPGAIRAYPAAATTEPAPLWVFANEVEEGFYGGVTVRPSPAPGLPARVYAASYAFAGGMNSANMVCLSADTGSLLWSAPTNRTASIPVVLPDNRILLAGGIRDFGCSFPSVSLWQDLGGSAVQVWDSALDTWLDDDHDGCIDPGEALEIGGWTQQPVITQFAGRTLAFVGVISPSAVAESADRLHVLDLDRTPSEAGFLLREVVGAGDPPAIAAGNLFSIGPSGLVALGPSPSSFDINADSTLTVDDLYDWELGVGERDIDRNGSIDSADRALLADALRHSPHGPGSGTP